MNIGTDFPFRLTQDLPDLEQYLIRFGAVMGRVRFWSDFEADQWRVCRSQDRGAQISGGAIQKQDNIRCAPRRLKPARTARFRSSVNSKSPSTCVMASAKSSMTSNCPPRDCGTNLRRKGKRVLTVSLSHRQRGYSRHPRR